jgi:hypothetical protein
MEEDIVQEEKGTLKAKGKSKKAKVREESVSASDSVSKALGVLGKA